MPYKVEAKSRMELRKLAMQIRKTLNLENTLYIPVLELLDVFSEIQPDFSYEIVEDCEFQEGIHADIDILSGTVRIRESVYNGACNGVGRDRMTIAHEMAHYIMLCLNGYKLTRTFDENIKVYEDPEWQAKCFAGEFMIGAHIVKGMDAKEISEKCGVTYAAATFQLERI